jgi:hypothetical protein
VLEFARLSSRFVLIQNGSCKKTSNDHLAQAGMISAN